MTEALKESLLAAIKEQNWKKLLKNNVNVSAEALQTLSKKEWGTIFEFLFDELSKQIESSALFREEADSIKFTKLVIKLCNQFLTLYSPSSTTQALSQILFNILELLHGCILQLSEDESKEKLNISNEICLLCELWWSQQRDNRDTLTPQTLSFLFLTSLSPSAKQSTITRLYNLRSALLQIDFQDESSESLKRIMQRVLISPLFVHNKKGKLFLVYLFGLHPNLIEELHNTIKSQLPICRKSISEAYGEIYFKAWKAASGPYLVNLEYKCIQDLMYHAIHCANVQTVVSIRRVLSVFHSKKKQRGVDQVLYRLYEPILWRSLKVANPIVRKNAATLLIDAFPLLDPDAPQTENDTLLQKQLGILESLLMDKSVQVRCVAIEGVARILSVFWELIPEHTIRVFLSLLFNDLVNDCSSPAVRVSVIEGIKYILDNHLSQHTLKVLLPRLAPMIHDASEKVRIAMVELLIYVKSIKAIRYFDVVPLEDLLSRLAMDTPAVCKKLTTLMIQSFFPYNKPSSIQVQRCIVMFKTNTDAARSFYSHVHSVVPLSAVAKLITALYRCIQKFIKYSNSNSKAKKDDTDTETGLTLADTPIAESMLEAVATLWDNIAQSITIKENEEVYHYLMEIVDEKELEEFISFFAKSKIGTASMLRMLSHVEAAKIPNITDKYFTLLTNLRVDDKSELDNLLGCLFAWGAGEKVLDFLNKQIAAPFTETKKKAAEKKSSKMSISDKCKRALDAVSLLMAKESTRLEMLSFSQHVMELMQNLLQYFILIQKRIYVNEEKRSDVVEDEVLIAALLTYCKLFLHISATFDEIEKDAEALKELIQWTREIIVPLFQQTSNNETSSRKRKSSELIHDKFLFLVTEKIVTVLIDCITFGLCSTQLIQQIVNTMISILAANDTVFLSVIMPITFKCIYQLHSNGHDNFATNLLNASLNTNPTLFTDSNDSKFAELLGCYQQSKLSSIIGDLSSFILESIELPDEDDHLELASEYDELKPMTAFVLQSLIKSMQWINGMTHYAGQYLLKSEYSLQSIWKVLQVLSILLNNLPKSKGRSSDLSSVHNCLIGIISKLPEAQSTGRKSSQLRSLANSLLQRTVVAQ